ncbi:hypothetical protein Q3G72_002617 [Acer saccharum]|nr:hypothetical protein Q3G72_002617 [Acer saccharum]
MGHTTRPNTLVTTYQSTVQQLPDRTISVGAPITHTAAAAAPSPSPQILQDSSANDALRTGEEDLDSLHELERAEVEDSDVEPRTDPSAQPSQTGTRTHNPITVLVVIGEEEEATIRADLLWQWSQFSNGGASNQRGTQKVNNNRSTTRGRNSRASGGWVDPKSSATIPKDAGKRRVHASGGQSAGHWYTSPEGRKVYFSKNGQELTGQIAYRQYRKENGAGFRKSKKKTNSRKKKTKS